MRAYRLPLVAVAAVAVVLPLARIARAEDEKPDPSDATRGYVGYQPDFVQKLTPEQRKQKGIERDTGMYVFVATPGAPAAVAGLEPDDVVLKIAGVAIDVSKIAGDDDGGFKKWLKGDFRAITSKIKPGDKVEMVVERKGKTLTLTPTAVSKAQYEEMVAAVAEDEKWGTVPDPARGGPPKETALDFEGLPEGTARPEGVYAVGQWEVTEEEEGAKNHVLRQEEMIPSADRLLAIVTGDGRAYADATVTCRARLRGGEQSVSAGLLFRMRSRGEGYAAVADGVARTFSIVALEKGKARVVASVALPSPKLKAWHTLSVTFAGKRLEASFDGSVQVAGEDTAFASGWAGLTCSQDSQTDFDDWKAVPAAK